MKQLVTCCWDTPGRDTGYTIPSDAIPVMKLTEPWRVPFEVENYVLHTLLDARPCPTATTGVRWRWKWCILGPPTNRTTETTGQWCNNNHNYDHHHRMDRLLWWEPRDPLCQYTFTNHNKLLEEAVEPHVSPYLNILLCGICGINQLKVSWRELERSESKWLQAYRSC